MTAIPARSRVAVHDRSRGFCEALVDGVCTGAAHHIHHRVLRSRGGTHDPSNLIGCCNPCHAWIHANPAKATELDLMRSATPLEGSTA